MRSLGVCLVLTLQTEDQSSTASPRSATSPRSRRRSTRASSLPCGENLLASGQENKSDWGTVYVVFTMSKFHRLCLQIFRILIFFCACLGCLCRRSEPRWYRWAAWHNHERGHSLWALHLQLGEKGEEELPSEKATRLKSLSSKQERVILQTEHERMQLCIVEIFKQDIMQQSMGHLIRPRNMLPNGHLQKYQ